MAPFLLCPAMSWYPSPDCRQSPTLCSPRNKLSQHPTTHLPVMKRPSAVSAAPQTRTGRRSLGRVPLRCAHPCPPMRFAHSECQSPARVDMKAGKVTLPCLPHNPAYCWINTYWVTKQCWLWAWIYTQAQDSDARESRHAQQPERPCLHAPACPRTCSASTSAFRCLSSSMTASSL